MLPGCRRRCRDSGSVVWVMVGVLRLRWCDRSDTPPRPHAATGLQQVATSAAGREGALVEPRRARTTAPHAGSAVLSGEAAADAPAPRDRGLVAPGGGGGLDPAGRRRDAAAAGHRAGAAGVPRQRLAPMVVPRLVQPLVTRSSTRASWSWSPTPRVGCSGAVGTSRRTPDGRRPRLRRGLRLDRGQRRDQRDRHRPGPRRAVHHPRAPSTSSSRTPAGAARRLRSPTRGPDGRSGIVDVSGPSRGLHPAELALVEMAARVTLARGASSSTAPGSTALRARAPLRCSPGSAVRPGGGPATATSRQRRAWMRPAGSRA